MRYIYHFYNLCSFGCFRQLLPVGLLLDCKWYVIILLFISSPTGYYFWFGDRLLWAAFLAFISHVICCISDFILLPYLFSLVLHEASFVQWLWIRRTSFLTMYIDNQFQPHLLVVTYKLLLTLFGHQYSVVRFSSSFFLGYVRQFFGEVLFVANQ